MVVCCGCVLWLCVVVVCCGCGVVCVSSLHVVAAVDVAVVIVVVAVADVAVAAVAVAFAVVLVAVRTKCSKKKRVYPCSYTRAANFELPMISTTSTKATG